MITRDPYGISRPPINPGRLPEPYPPAETMDTPENVERCLPYLTDGHGNTLYTLYSSGTLRLGDGT